MPAMEWIWLAAGVVFLILEGVTSALVSLWFVGGSLVSMVAALLGAPLWLQIVLFFVVSAALLLALRPLSRKYLKPKRSATNAAGNIGKTAIVTEEINNLQGVGAVKIAGVTWSARSEGNVKIEKDALVTVKAIEGVKVIVKEEKL